MCDNMSLTDSVWDALYHGFKEIQMKYPELKFNSDKKGKFNQLYEKTYNEIIEKYITKKTQTLDAHKQAAIIIVCCLKLKVIDVSMCSKHSDNADINLIPQIIAINVGLSYMLECLNRILKSKHIYKHIERYYLPIAFACDTPYEKVMCRLLANEQNSGDLTLVILELADRLFLLEYINLLQYKIEPSLLKSD